MTMCVCMGIGELIAGLVFLVLGWLGIRRKRAHRHQHGNPKAGE
jgi:hypothetical protein